LLLIIAGIGILGFAAYMLVVGCADGCFSFIGQIMLSIAIIPLIAGVTLVVIGIKLRKPKQQTGPNL
jgi:hypothetical protein